MNHGANQKQLQAASPKKTPTRFSRKFVTIMFLLDCRTDLRATWKELMKENGEVDRLLKNPLKLKHLNQKATRSKLKMTKFFYVPQYKKLSNLTIPDTLMFLKELVRLVNVITLTYNNNLTMEQKQRGFEIINQLPIRLRDSLYNTEIASCFNNFSKQALEDTICYYMINNPDEVQFLRGEASKQLLDDIRTFSLETINQMQSFRKYVCHRTNKDVTPLDRQTIEAFYNDNKTVHVEQLSVDPLIEEGLKFNPYSIDDNALD